MKSQKSAFCSAILILGLLLLFGFGLNRDLRAGVTSVTVSVTPANFTGQCPKALTFTGNILVTQGGELRYRWIRSDGGKGPIKGGEIIRNGTVIVTNTWTLGQTGRSFRNYWMAIEILPETYRINTIYPSVTPLMTSNRAYFTLNCVNEVVAIPSSEVLPNNRIPGTFTLPEWEISGRISGNPGSCVTCLQGRKVKIILRKGSTVTNHVVTLDRNSSYNYRFRAPFISAGTYTISIEKGPPDQANYGNDLNICFNGASPSTRTVTLSSSSKKALNQDFQIAFSLLWGGSYPLCW
jgi:hypothetical protein